MQATLANLTITNAAAIAVVSVSPLQMNDAARSLAAQATFGYGSGGTTVDAYLQTSLDGGVTWVDIAQWHFTTSSARPIYNLSSLTPKTTAVTPTDGTLASNSAVDGVLGHLFRVKVASTGTYAGNTTLRIDVEAQER